MLAAYVFIAISCVNGHAATTLKQSWEIAHTEFKLGTLLGAGTFGDVYQAQWRDMAVAVKVIA